MTDMKQYFTLARLQIRMALNTLKYGTGRKGGGDKKAAARMIGLLVLYGVLAGYVIFLEIKVMDAAIYMRMPGLLMQLVALAATMLSAWCRAPPASISGRIRSSTRPCPSGAARCIWPGSP